MRRLAALLASAGFVLGATAVRAANPAWSITPVDTVGSAGWSPSLAFDTVDGNPSIAFIELSKNQVKFSDWNGVRWVTENVATGAGPDLAYDLAGRPCLSLIYGTKAEIRFARREGGRWTFQYVDKGIFGEETSLAFDAQGNPAIAYEFPNRKTKDLKLARWNGVTWSTQVVEAAAGARYLSLTFDAQGNPAIAYSSDANADGRIDALRFARWDGTRWSYEVVDTIVSGGGFASISLARDPVGGELAIAYAKSEVPKGPRFARRTVSGWVVETIEVVDFVFHTSLAFDAAGRAYVYYVDGKNNTEDLQVAWRDAGVWSSEVIETLATSAGSPTCFALGPGGVPAVSYRDSPANALKYAVRSAAP